ncbi:MAG TPA: hypothetical protein VMG32_00215 [Anaeromyxobacteraceae bacterium]|nr:hypothetical protein [Anaeromyxobacteraceae bacterium]
MDRETPTAEDQRPPRHRIALFGSPFPSRPALLRTLRGGLARAGKVLGAPWDGRAELVDLGGEFPVELPCEEVLESLGPGFDLFLCASPRPRRVDVRFARAIARLGKPCLFLLPARGGPEGPSARAEAEPRRVGDGAPRIYLRGDADRDAERVVFTVHHWLEATERKARARTLRASLASAGGEGLQGALDALLSGWPAANEPDGRLPGLFGDAREEARGSWLDPRTLGGYEQEREDVFLGALWQDLA